MPYTDTMTHKLTVAAVHTPHGESLETVDAIEELHAEKCTTCPKVREGHTEHATPLAQLIGLNVTVHMTRSDAWTIVTALRAYGEDLMAEALADHLLVTG